MKSNTTTTRAKRPFVSMQIEFPRLYDLVTNEERVSVRELLEISITLDTHPHYMLHSHYNDDHAWDDISSQNPRAEPIDAWREQSEEFRRAALSAFRRLINHEVVARLKSRQTKTKHIWRADGTIYLSKGVPTAAFRF